MKSMAQIKAIERKNEQKLLSLFPDLNQESGIYFLTRTDESAMRFAYIGQAKHILSRLAQHMSGYQHIDLSIRKHGFYSEDNPNGWKVGYLNFPEGDLDKEEVYYIQMYANAGYQLRNKTGGSQGEGKRQIDEYRPAKGYRDGLTQGYKNASRDMAKLFDKHLVYSTKSEKPNKNALKAMEKFQSFLELHKVETPTAKQ